MANVQELTDQTFDATLKDSKLPVLVDFSAGWCQPCKVLAPTIDAVASEYDGKLAVFKVDIEQAEETAAHFGISSVPTCIFFKDGREVDRFFGVKDMRGVKKHVDNVLA